MSELTTIHMPLLDEGTDVWRPVKAERMSDDTFRVLGPVPETEEWAFPPGTIVRCRYQTLSGDFGVSVKRLVAYEQISN
jgi:hypothetical protein